MKNEKEIRYFSMFTGVGGFELGIGGVNNYQQLEERENSSTTINKYQCIGFSENDKYCSELLKKRFLGIKNYGDATKIIPTELPNFDLLVGGFPCQSFSIAGKRKGFEDTRCTLFYEILRTLEVKRPEYLLLENVKGLLSHDNGRTFAIILASLSKLGYVIQWMVLNSKFFGVPQNRERVFIIGSLRGTSIPEILPLQTINQEIVELQGQQTNTLKARYTAIGDGSYIAESKFNAQIHSLYPRSSKTKKGGLGHLTKNDDSSYALDTGNMQGIEILDLYNKKSHSDRSPTLTEPHHNTLRVREGKRIRRLTPIECERLQGFPDNWTEGFSDTQRYKMMGNAVTVNVIKAIMEKLIK